MAPGAASGVARFDAPGAARYTRKDAPADPGYMSNAPKIEPPRVSDYAIAPETNMEMFQGEVREASPAGPLHSRQHLRVTVVVHAYTAPGYGSDLDLLTRQSRDNNFASDTCIRKDGYDPATGDRYLEEIAFEIKSTQDEKNLRERARIMTRRGVRRVFAISVRGDAAAMRLEAGPVREWDAVHETWRVLGRDEVIEDPCLYRPLPVRALLDAVEADRAAARAFFDRYPDIVEEYANARAQQALRDSLLMFLEMRGIVLDAGARERIAGCTDVTTLQRWLVRAASAGTTLEIFAAG